MLKFKNFEGVLLAEEFISIYFHRLLDMDNRQAVKSFPGMGGICTVPKLYCIILGQQMK
jgi:hypothetical protein